MKIDGQLSDEVILEELGQRLARQRLDLGLTQAELAEQSGVSKRTVERIEAGHTAQMKTIVRVLRTLRLIGGLDHLIAEAGPRPMDQLMRRGQTRKRASSRSRKAGRKTWSWGDES